MKMNGSNFGLDAFLEFFHHALVVLVLVEL